MDYQYAISRLKERDHNLDNKDGEKTPKENRVLFKKGN
jgi:hypothetical protein